MLGVVLLFQSVNVALQYSDVLYEPGATNQMDASHLSRGITLELLAGMAGMVLGVLALLGIVPTTLLSVAAITYGAAFLLTSGESLWLDSLGTQGDEVVGRLIRSMSLSGSWCSGPVGIGRDGARHSGTGRHCGDDDGAGRISSGGRFNSVAEFVSRSVTAGLPAEVINCLRNGGEPLATAIFICNRKLMIYLCAAAKSESSIAVTEFYQFVV